MNAKSIYTLLIILTSSFSSIQACAAESEHLWFLEKPIPNNAYIVFNSGGNPKNSKEQACKMAETALQHRTYVTSSAVKQSLCVSQPFISEKNYVWIPVGEENSTKHKDNKKNKKSKNGCKQWHQLLIPQNANDQIEPQQKNPLPALIRTKKDINLARNHWQKEAKKRRMLLNEAHKQVESLATEEYMYIVSQIASLLMLKNQEQRYQSSVPITTEQLKKTNLHIDELRKKIPVDIRQLLNSNIETRNTLLELLQLENQKNQIELTSASELTNYKIILTMQEAQKKALYNAWNSFDVSAFNNKTLYEMALHKKRRAHLASHPDAHILEITLSDEELATFIHEYKLNHLFANISQQEYELLRETFPTSLSSNQIMIIQNDYSAKPPAAQASDEESSDADVSDISQENSSGSSSSSTWSNMLKPW